MRLCASCPGGARCDCCAVASAATSYDFSRRCPLTILAIGPHPDDVELGCAGAILKSRQQGKEVVIADLTGGEMSSAGDPQTRQREAMAARDILGVKSRINLGLADTALENCAESRLELISLLRSLRPDIVLAPYEQDRHPDHRNAAALVRDACFFAGVRKIGKGEPFRPKRLYSYLLHATITPSFVIDVSTVWPQKCQAIGAYVSQFTDQGSNQQTVLNTDQSFLQVVESKARVFGAMIGVGYGEGFVSQGPIATHDLYFGEDAEEDREWLSYRSF